MGRQPRNPAPRGNRQPRHRLTDRQLHPEAVGFASHYDFDIDVLAAYRPTGKGRVERQVLIVRNHVLAGRAFACLEEMDAAFMAWVPQRRARTHATHHEVIGHRAARDHAALKPLPPTPYPVAEAEVIEK
jgi:transposase